MATVLVLVAGVLVAGIGHAQTPGDAQRSFCDRLAGPERAFCLKRGGTVKADAAPQRR
jgi:putative hemolysin